MKQCITQAQYEELSSLARQRYIAWTCTKPDPTVAYRCIGHLIQFLDEHLASGWWRVERSGSRTVWRIASKYGPDFEDYDYGELCDALWNAVKLVLGESK